MRRALTISAVGLLCAVVAHAAKPRESVHSVQLDLFLDRPVRAPVAEAESAELGPVLTENPLEAGPLSPGLSLPVDDAERRAFLTGQPETYARAVKDSDVHYADDDSRQALLAEAADRREADRRWAARNGSASSQAQPTGPHRSVKDIDFATFGARVDRVLNLISVQNVFDNTELKRDILRNSNVLYVRGGRGTPIADATPAQVGRVFKTYYEALKKRRSAN